MSNTVRTQQAEKVLQEAKRQLIAVIEEPTEAMVNRWAGASDDWWPLLEAVIAAAEARAISRIKS